MHQKFSRLLLCLTCLLAAPILQAADFAVATDGGGHVDAAIAGGAELPNNWTFSAWVYFTEGGSYAPGDSPIAVATSQDFIAEGLSAEVLIDADVNGQQRLELGRSNSYIGEHSTLTIPTNVWTHVAITVSSTKVVRYYINGQAAGVFATEFASRDVSLGNTGTGLIRFMENNGYNRKFKGGLDDVQIWNTERSPEEIQAAMSTRPAGNEPNLVAWYPFDEGTGISSTNGDTLASSDPATLVNTVTWVPGVRGNVVLNVNDTGAGSLRQMVIDARAGSIITFAPALSGQTILLTNGEIELTTGITIDSSTLANGIQISDNASSRVFGISDTVVLNALTITNAFSSFGGGIINMGTLTVNNCTFAGNHASNFSDGGGAIENWGGATLTVINSTFTGNYVDGGNNDGGGAIVDEGGTLTVINSTFIGNQSGTSGGGIHCYGTLNLTNSIVCSNTASASPNIAGTFSFANNLVDTNALLAPLGNYGGPTQTMPPLPGSPAVDAATVIAGLTTDQRGYPRPVGLAADIGAVEGVYNAAGPGKITSFTRLGNGSVRFSLTNLTDAEFLVLATTNLNQSLANWTQIGFATESPVGSGQFPFTDTQATNYAQRFYRVKSP